MFAAQVTSLMERALVMVLILSGPPILAASIVGLLVGVVQSATQLHEQTLQYALKFLAIALTLFLTAGLLGGVIFRFAEEIFRVFPALVRL